MIDKNYVTRQNFSHFQRRRIEYASTDSRPPRKTPRYLC